MVGKLEHTDLLTLTRWSNFHGTLDPRPIPRYFTPRESPQAWKPLVDSVREVLRYCFAQAPLEPLRVIGSRWSLSKIVEPKSSIFDPSHLNHMAKVNPAWLTPSYVSTRGAAGFVPVLVQGGAEISGINKRLGELGFALQTTGASDGHLLAGCTATGTHGSALNVGAVHDTVLGVHLIVAPDKALFLQPVSAACSSELTNWLSQTTGIPTEHLVDDELFHAAQVSLGALGFVHALVVEATPLYRLRRRILALPADAPSVWNAIRTLNTAALHPNDPQPHHFEIVFHPYPSADRPGAFVVLMFKEDAGGAPFTSPSIVTPDATSDAIDLIGQLVRLFDTELLAGLASPALSKILSDQLEKRYKPATLGPDFPGSVFGPTSTPKGHGTSTEIVVPHDHAVAALDQVKSVLSFQGSRGRHVLGPVAVRFVKQTSAFLGMNISPMNCYIEMPSIRTDEVKTVYFACFDALEKAKIPFTCHWGQVGGLTPQRVRGYFGGRVDSWMRARSRLLDASGRIVFGTPFLSNVGLDQ